MNIFYTLLTYFDKYFRSLGKLWDTRAQVGKPFTFKCKAIMCVITIVNKYFKEQIVGLYGISHISTFPFSKWSEDKGIFVISNK